MFLLTEFLKVWMLMAIPVTALVMYLTVNKIWIRRHELIVTESISVAAKLLALFAVIPYLIVYTIDGPYVSAIKALIIMAADVALILIGAGFWVREKRNKSFWTNIRSALRMERGEASTLLRDVFHPVAARKLVRILCDFAMIDRELEKREIEFIARFAARWNVDFEAVLAESQQQRSGDPAAYARLRDSVDDYLAHSPPMEQAHQLGEVLLLLAQADEKTTAEESVMLDELLGLIDCYVSGDQGKGYLVVIAPQNDAQIAALETLHPEWPQEQRLGGRVLRIGRYFSSRYAEMVCQWYRESGYLTFATAEAAS